MTALVWGETSFFQRGVDRGVVYSAAGVGQVWDGLVAVNERDSSLENSPSYYDGRKINTGKTPGEYSAVVRGYSPPVLVLEAAGTKHLGAGLILSNQETELIGMSYRTMIGDRTSEDLAYLIHVVYGATLTPSSRNFDTLGTNVAPVIHEWTIDAIPQVVEGRLATAHIMFDTRYMSSGDLLAIEDILYGTSVTSPAIKSLAYWMNILGVS